MRWEISLWFCRKSLENVNNNLMIVKRAFTHHSNVSNKIEEPDRKIETRKTHFHGRVTFKLRPHVTCGISIQFFYFLLFTIWFTILMESMSFHETEIAFLVGHHFGIFFGCALILREWYKIRYISVSNMNSDIQARKKNAL